MSRKSDRLELIVLGSMLTISTIFNTLRHPVKTYRLVFQGVPWYD